MRTLPFTNEHLRPRLSSLRQLHYCSLSRQSISIITGGKCSYHAENMRFEYLYKSTERWPQFVPHDTIRKLTTVRLLLISFLMLLLHFFGSRSVLHTKYMTVT